MVPGHAKHHLSSRLADYALPLSWAFHTSTTETIGAITNISSMTHRTHLRVLLGELLVHLN